MRRTMVALAAAALSFGAFAQQRNFDAVQIKTTQVAPGIYMLEGEGGNIGVSSGEDGVFLIDDQFAPLTPKIVAAVKAISDKPIRFLMNTHWHGDHVGGNVERGRDAHLLPVLPGRHQLQRRDRLHPDGSRERGRHLQHDEHQLPRWIRRDLAVEGHL